MSVSFLCVQFRNLLPSEDLLLFARACWNEAQAHGKVSPTAGDATLCITQTASKLAPFEIELTIAGRSLCSVSSHADPIAAVEAAFSQLGPLHEFSTLPAHAALGETAPTEQHVSRSDTLLA